MGTLFAKKKISTKTFHKNINAKFYAKILTEILIKWGHSIKIESYNLIIIQSINTILRIFEGA